VASVPLDGTESEYVSVSTCTGIDGSLSFNGKNRVFRVSEFQMESHASIASVSGTCAKSGPKIRDIRDPPSANGQFHFFGDQNLAAARLMAQGDLMFYRLFYAFLAARRHANFSRPNAGSSSLLHWIKCEGSNRNLARDRLPAREYLDSAGRSNITFQFRFEILEHYCF
jgi:hypothetical protein